jgi:hypothetical protein
VFEGKYLRWGLKSGSQRIFFFSYIGPFCCSTTAPVPECCHFRNSFFLCLGTIMGHPGEAPCKDVCSDNGEKQ